MLEPGFRRAAPASLLDQWPAAARLRYWVFGEHAPAGERRGSPAAAVTDVVPQLTEGRSEHLHILLRQQSWFAAADRLRYRSRLGARREEPAPGLGNRAQSH